MMIHKLEREESGQVKLEYLNISQDPSVGSEIQIQTFQWLSETLRTINVLKNNQEMSTNPAPGYVRTCLVLFGYSGPY